MMIIIYLLLLSWWIELIFSLNSIINNNDYIIQAGQYMAMTKANNNNLQSYQMLSSLLVLIAKGEQIVQAIKEVLTTKQMFHPLSLFKYLAKGNSILSRKHIQMFLQQNDFSASEQQIKIIFQFEGVNDKMNYSTFLQMIYPFSMGCIRQISNTHLKRYSQIECLPVSEQIIYAFFILLTQQISLINKIQVQKKDSSTQIQKDKLKKLIKNIKKVTDKKIIHCDSDQNIISSLQLINFVRMFSTVKIQENLFLYMMRKLEVDNKGAIKIQNLQNMIKPWKKSTKKGLNTSCLTKGDKNLSQTKGNSYLRQTKENINLSQINDNLHQRENLKKFNQSKYKQQLYKQMSSTLRQVQKTQKQKCSQIKNKQGQIYHRSPSKQQKRIQNKSTTPKKSNKKIKARPNGVDVKLFLKFIQTFIKNIKQIESLKVQLQNQHKVDFLKIFKELDKRERGVITSEDLLRYYQSLGGMSISANFQLLISTISVSSQKWLSYTQFCQIFKPSFQKSKQKNANNLTGVHETKRLMSQIIYLSLKNEQQLLQIRRQFKKGQAEHLFFLINKQETGFINYQQLKAFLLNVNLQLSMQQLMFILKRLDRGKNGVVTEIQFEQYFCIGM